jgi:hypothetical protein
MKRYFWGFFIYGLILSSLKVRISDFNCFAGLQSVSELLPIFEYLIGTWFILLVFGSMLFTKVASKPEHWCTWFGMFFGLIPPPIIFFLLLLLVQ